MSDSATMLDRNDPSATHTLSGAILGGRGCGSLARPIIAWIDRSGRDSSGDRFNHHIAMHGSGRMLAKIYSPVAGDDYSFRAAFYCSVPKRVLANQEETFDFIDLESAEHFVEGVLAQLDATAKPEEVKP